MLSLAVLIMTIFKFSAATSFSLPDCVGDSVLNFFSFQWDRTFLLSSLTHTPLPWCRLFNTSSCPFFRRSVGVGFRFWISLSVTKSRLPLEIHHRLAVTNFFAVVSAYIFNCWYIYTIHSAATSAACRFQTLSVSWSCQVLFCPCSNTSFVDRIDKSTLLGDASPWLSINRYFLKLCIRLGRFLPRQ